jgi:two-component system, OmpR family, sensor kinase
MRPLRARLSRLPLWARLVAGFSAAMLVVLVGAGVFVYWRVEYALDRGLDTELAQASQTLDPLISAQGTVGHRSAAEATGVAWQVLDAGGSVLDHGGPATTRGMVSPRQLSTVGATARTIDVGDFLPASSEPYRLRVSETSASPQHYLLVGVRRDHRDEALRELLAQLGLAGLVALVITAFVGERLARAALRPVERYRRRAAEIAEGAIELRLDVPPQRDDEVTRLGHTFNDMLATLERALDRERQFVNEASHELRTPITLLTSRIQLARRRARSVAEHEHVLAELQIDLDRLARLAEQLLQLGAASAEAAHGPSDLAAVATRVVSQRNLASPEAATELYAGTAPAAIADVEAERIVTNLLDNARTHGSAPYRVHVDRPVPTWSRLCVSDAGPGMPPDLLAGATQRFARADDARARPGAGLGLALVDTLVRQAGGELRLCSGGHHASHGRPAPVPCEHGPEMTVTVLLPS